MKGAEGPPARPTALPFHPAPAPRGVVGRYYSAVALSFVGDWLTTVALVVVLFELTRNPAAPAAYVLVRVAPRLAGPWMGGGFADRFSPRAVMAGAAIAQGLLTASLILSHRTAALWAIYLTVALAQFIGAVSRPAQAALLAGMVAPQRLGQANAVYSLLFGSSLFAGPAIGALLLVGVGADPLFAIDAATFLVAAALALSLPAAPRSALRQAPEFDVGIWHGISQAMRDPLIRLVALGQLGISVAVTAAQALLVVGAHQQYGGDARVGYLYAAVGLGTTVGALLALRWQPPRRLMGPAIATAIIGNVVCIGAFPLLGSLSAAMAVLSTSSLLGGSLDIWGGTQIQQRAPPGYMGRFNSVVFVGMYGGALVGALWAIGAVSFLSWDRVIELAGAAALALMLAVVAVDLRAVLRAENRP